MNIELLMEKGWVSFPNILPNTGLKVPINDVAFSVGGYDIKWYGIIICLGVLLSIFLAMRSCEKHGISKDDLFDYILFSIPSAILGARIYYVVFNFDDYRDDLISVFYYWNGGLAVYGGVIAALIAAACVAKYKKQSFIKIAGFAAPYIVLGQAIGRWGNFFNQEAFGGQTKLPWGMNGNLIESFVEEQGWDYGTLVHPTFLYESLWCFITFAIIMIYRRKFEKLEGESLCLYMILYGAERAFVEGLRTDSLYIGSSNVRVSQLLSVILIVLGIAMLIDIRHKWKTRIVEEGTADSDKESELVKVREIIEKDRVDFDELSLNDVISNDSSSEILTPDDAKADSSDNEDN